MNFQRSARTFSAEIQTSVLGRGFSLNYSIQPEPKATRPVEESLNQSQE